jgi:hypothetical protein
MTCSIAAMRNYVSYSLFGNGDKYVLGAIENAKSVKSVYPGWTAIFYCGPSINADVVRSLKGYSAEVKRVQEAENSLSMLWRFRALFLPDAHRVIFRDTDSRLSIREARAVEEWRKSQRDLHIIRDHPNHMEAIMGGMWGAKAEKLKRKTNLVFPGNVEVAYGIDQEILRRDVYRDPTLSRLVHDSYFVRELDSRYLAPDRHGSFIGEAIGGDNSPDLQSRELINRHQSSKSFRMLIQLRHLRKIFFDLGVDFAPYARHLFRK